MFDAIPRHSVAYISSQYHVIRRADLHSAASLVMLRLVRTSVCNRSRAFYKPPTQDNPASGCVWSALLQYRNHDVGASKSVTILPVLVRTHHKLQELASPTSEASLMSLDIKWTASLKLTKLGRLGPRSKRLASQETSLDFPPAMPRGMFCCKPSPVNKVCRVHQHASREMVLDGFLF